MDDSKLPQCTFVALRPISPDILSCFDAGLKAKRRRHLHARGANRATHFHRAARRRCRLAACGESVAGRANAAHSSACSCPLPDDAEFQARVGLSGAAVKWLITGYSRARVMITATAP